MDAWTGRKLDIGSRRADPQQIQYVLGHSDLEVQRLLLQSAIIRPITIRLLREAGLSAGMRVLDLGCGASDVTMLAADLVGRSGSVVGLDRNADILSVARQRAHAAGYTNLEFVEGSVDGTGKRSFDMVVGRYILVHQSDPASLIRLAASHARPGGVVAFHEVQGFGDVQSRPRVPLWHEAWSWIVAGFASGMAHADAGARLIEHFSTAGLDLPAIFSEIPSGGGPASPLYAWMTQTLRSLLPRLKAGSLIDAAKVDVKSLDSLEERIREAVTSARSQVGFAQQYCAWTKV
jgi:ubiquinone/menaquinone biosynthesis C-methylase UbiE